jgi:hypothetical protein
MLPSILESIRQRLTLATTKTQVQRNLLDELNEINKALEPDEVKKINEGLEKRGSTKGGLDLWGPGPNACNFCGRR